MSSPLRTPDYRDSTASNGGFASIGNMVSSPYSEDESHESLRTPVTPQTSPARIGTVRETKYLPPGKDHLVARVKSFEGKIDRHSYYSDEDEGVILAFDRPSPDPSPRQVPSQPVSTGRPMTVVHFPEPTLVSPMRSHAPIRPSPRRPQIQIPRATLSPRPILHQPSEHFTIPTLPCSGTPVSPHLALPRSPFAAAQAGSRDSVSSISSESIRGFELMKEKKALFRGGEEELMSPFSPRKNGGRQESGLRPGAKKGVGRGVSTVDFWKRFSVSVRLDQISGKESEWLNDTQKKRKSIRWLAFAAFGGVILIAAAIVVAVMVVQNAKPKAVESRGRAG